ncbi:MAG: VWA domain-containing protein [Myxococcales bacterium]|nr:VWA domain-containing protein [Myxococcales bacterium]
MTWHSGQLLWLLLSVPALAGLLLWAWRVRRATARRFGAPDGKPQMVVGRSAGLRAARAVILLAGVALTVVALARPQYGSREKTLRKRGVDVVVVVDFSKSMLAQDVRPSRIERAKAELTRFISELAGDRVGIVAFAGETMEFPMTVDYAAAALFFRELGPADMPVGGTAIGRALTSAKRLLERSTRTPKAEEEEGGGRARVVILLTDGEDHEGDPAQAAEELAGIDAKVFVVAVGSRSGEAIPTYAQDGTWTGYLRDQNGNAVLTTLTPQAEQQLKQIAEITGGAYFEPRSGTVGIDQIRAQMRRMKQTELEARRVTVHEERYALVLLLAFLLIVLEALLPEAWMPRSGREETSA